MICMGIPDYQFTHTTTTVRMVVADVSTLR